ncbi:MAG: hypothetical protein LUG62_02390 [Clostridiales bacterium]|nr:hypothetical protein [Clostridiales bacterium]
MNRKGRWAGAAAVCLLTAMPVTAVEMGGFDIYVDSGEDWSYPDDWDGSTGGTGNGTDSVTTGGAGNGTGSVTTGGTGNGTGSVTTDGTGNAGDSVTAGSTGNSGNASAGGGTGSSGNTSAAVSTGDAGNSSSSGSTGNSGSTASAGGGFSAGEGGSSGSMATAGGGTSSAGTTAASTPTPLPSLSPTEMPSPTVTLKVSASPAPSVSVPQAEGQDRLVPSYYEEDWKENYGRKEYPVSFACLPLEESGAPALWVRSDGCVQLLSFRVNGVECSWHWEGNFAVPETEKGKDSVEMEVTALTEGGNLVYWSGESGG